MEHRHQPDEGGWQAKAKWALLGFLAVGAFFLLSEHRAHALGFLPFLILLACPLMHLFMHGGHGAHGGDESGSGESSNTKNEARK